MKHGGGSIGISLKGCFSWFGVGNLHKINGIMDARYYNNILAHNLKESARKMNIADQFIFMQDNDPKHTAGVTKRFFENTAINLLDWPPRSADLNPIGNLWSTLDSNVPPSDRTITNIFYERLRTAWNGLSPDYLEKLVGTMQQRLQAVIQV